jgi:prophage regulatory protein
MPREPQARPLIDRAALPRRRSTRSRMLETTAPASLARDEDISLTESKRRPRVRRQPDYIPSSEPSLDRPPRGLRSPMAPRAPPSDNPLSILRRRAVCAKTGLAVSSLYDLVARNKFPKPIALSVRRVGWLEQEVNDWIEARIAASREVGPVLRRRRRGDTKGAAR